MSIPKSDLEYAQSLYTALLRDAEKTLDKLCDAEREAASTAETSPFEAIITGQRQRIVGMRLMWRYLYPLFDATSQDEKFHNVSSMPRASVVT